MSEGAFKIFYLATAVFVVTGMAADPVAPGPNVPAGVVTNAVPLSVTDTNTIPEVVGGTNTVITAEEKAALEALEAEKARSEARAAAEVAEKKKLADALRRLGIYSVIPTKDPFRLTKPKKEEEKKTTIVERPTFGVPHLAGISRLNGVRAVLRVNPARGGKPRYVQLKEGEKLLDANGNDYGEVVTINTDEGIVDVRVRGKTFPLEVDRTKFASAKTTSSSRYQRSGSSSRYSRGGSSSSSRFSRGGTTSSRTNRPGTSSPSSKTTNPSAPSGTTKPKPSGGGLQGIPSRRPSKTGALDLPVYEMPAFNVTVQRLAVNPLDIAAQREIIRGQYSRETPTDLPQEQR